MDSDEVNEAPRAGVIAACDLCRKRKVRCELQRPCKKCARAGTPCRTTKFDRIRFNPDTVGQSPKRHRPNAQRRDTSTQLRTTNCKSVGATSRESDASAASCSSPRPSTRPRTSKPTEWPRSSLYLDEEGQIVIAGSISGLPMLEQLGGLDRFDVPAAASSSTTSSSISESARALVPPGLRGGAGTLSVSHQAFKDKVLRETDGYQEADNGDLVMSPLDIWSLIIYTCPADLLDLLIRQYLTKSEVLYPILHHPSFLRTYDETRGCNGSEPAGCSAAFAGLIMAMCSVASRAIHDHRCYAIPGLSRSSGLHYWQLSRQFLAIADSALDIRFLQSLFLLAVFAEGLDNASIHSSLLGEAVALALTTGIHRSGDDQWDMGIAVVEERKRLFWALWNYEKASALVLGRPPLLRLRDANTQLPSEYRDDLLGTGNIDRPSSAQRCSNRAASNHLLLWSDVAEQLLEVSRAPRRSPSQSSDGPDAFLAALADTFEVEAGDYATLDGVSEKIKLVDRLSPPAFASMSSSQLSASHISTPEETSHLAPPPSELAAVHGARFSILNNYFQSLVARERLFRLINEGMGTNSPLDEAAIQVAHEVKRRCIEVVDLYRVLQQRALLSDYFGNHHVEHLQNAGITSLILMSLCPSMTDECTENLRAVTELLLVSCEKWPSAAKTMRLLESMAAELDVTWVPASSRRADLVQRIRPSLRLLPRRTKACYSRESSRSASASASTGAALSSREQSASDTEAYSDNCLLTKPLPEPQKTLTGQEPSVPCGSTSSRASELPSRLELDALGIKKVGQDGWTKASSPNVQQLARLLLSQGAGLSPLL